MRLALDLCSEIDAEPQVGSEQRLDPRVTVLESRRRRRVEPDEARWIQLRQYEERSDPALADRNRCAGVQDLRLCARSPSA